MTDTLMVGLVGAACTVAAPLIAVYVQRHVSLRKYRLLSDVPNSAGITGTWAGTATVRDAKSPGTYTLQFQFQPHTREVSGTVHVTTEGRGWDLVIKGGFVSDRYLRLDYWSPEKNVLQFGTILLELLADGCQMNGRHVSYSRDRSRLVYGAVEMKKG